MSDDNGFIMFTHRCGPFEVFASDAFDGVIGKSLAVRDDRDGSKVTGRLVSAKVAEDGSSVDLTISVPREWMRTHVNDGARDSWSIA